MTYNQPRPNLGEQQGTSKHFYCEVLKQLLGEIFKILSQSQLVYREQIIIPSKTSHKACNKCYNKLPRMQIQ